MTREEFLKRIEKAILTERYTQNVLVDPDTIFLLGDEDGDVCFSYRWSTTDDPTSRSGYHYLDMSEIMDLVCDD